jgi:phosphopantetheine adenylyltransferase
MTDEAWKAHISYLESEVAKIAERVEKLEKIIPELKDEQRKHFCLKRIRDLRGQAHEHRKYLSLVTRFVHDG